MRLRRSSPSRPGYTRRRRGKGFTYHDLTGAAITDQVELERIRALVILAAVVLAVDELEAAAAITERIRCRNRP